MHAVLDQIHRHRSIRKFRPQPVGEEVLTRILEAAVRASSSGNMQAYSVIVPADANVRQEMLAAHFHQEMVLEAPLFLTFCANFHRMRRWISLSDAPENFDNFMSFMIATIDATLAAQTAALAAEAEGLGLCFLGTTLASCDEIARILQCPSHVVPVVDFALGYAAEEPTSRDRLPLQSLVHRERYRPTSDAEVLQTYAARESARMKRYRENPKLKEQIDAAGVENLAQVYTHLKSMAAG